MFALVCVPPRAAGTWIVDSDADPLAGAAANCAAANAGTCTLRDAIAAAASGDTVVFGRDTTITLAGALALADDVTIDAGGLTGTVDGNQAGSVFHVPDPASRVLTFACDVGAVEAGSIADSIFAHGFDLPGRPGTRGLTAGGHLAGEWPFRPAGA